MSSETLSGPILTSDGIPLKVSLRKAERAEVALKEFPYQTYYRTPYTLSDYEKALQNKFYMKGYSGWGQPQNEPSSLVTVAVIGIIAYFAIREIAR